MSKEKNKANINVVHWAGWFFVIVFSLAAISIDIVFSDQTVLYRFIAMVVLLGMAIVAFLFTDLGKKAIELFKGARFELKKVVWPTRVELIQTVLLVLIVVILTSFLIWLFDIVILWLIGLLLG